MFTLRARVHEHLVGPTRMDDNNGRPLDRNVIPVCKILTPSDHFNPQSWS